MEEITTDILLLALVLQCLAFAAALFTTRRGRHLSNSYLAVLLLVFSFQTTLNLLEGHDIYFIPVSRSLSLFYGPLLLIYTQSVINPSFRLTRLHLFHMVLLFPGIGMYYQWPMEWLFLSKLILGHFMAYAGYATWLIIRFHNNQKQLNPSPRGIAIQWIIELIIGIILVMSISLKFDVLHSEFQFNTYVILLFLIINLIGFKGVLRSNSFLGVPENVVLAAHDAKEKYINTQLSSKDILAHALTIQNVIEKERLHLDPDLTLSSFSEILNLTPRVISQVINQHFGQNFSHFINEHRLTHAKLLLTSSTNTEKNISQVIYESGFNSKTRFYSLFKKLTNQSPKMYRAQNSRIED